MGAVHEISRAPRASKRTRRILQWIVGGVGALTIIGAIVVWPQDTSYRGSIPTKWEGAEWVTATVVEGEGEFGELLAVVGDGEPQPMFGTENVTLVPEVGDRVIALSIPEEGLVFTDFERSSPMIALFIVYIVLVVAIAWWRGIGSLLGLFIAFGIVIFFTVPSLFDGHHPLVVGLVTGSGALFVLLYLAHGPNARTTTAYLGTLAGLVVTAFLAWWAVSASKLTGLWNEAGLHLEFLDRGVSLQGLILCGVILAGLGVLNDVTVTQASAVWELRAARPEISRYELYTRGMRIGRDHIASTVYTIAFAYVGAALPTIMLVSLYDASMSATLTSVDIAEEIIRTLVGSIGLVLAVPLTTAIGAVVVGEKAVDSDQTVSPLWDRVKRIFDRPDPALAGQPKPRES